MGAAAGARPLYFHIGVHRTGTTFLQQKAFPGLRGVEYLHLKILKDERYVKNFAALDLPEVREALARETDVPLLVSDESLLRPGYGQRSGPGLDELQGRHPEARIILGFRRQDAWLKSIYNNYLLIGGVRRLAQFHAPGRDSGLVHDADMRWMEIVRGVREHFGHDPFVYLLEEFDGNLEGIFEDLCAFLGDVEVDPEALRRDPVFPSGSRSEQRGWFIRNRFLRRRRSPRLLATWREIGVADWLLTPFRRLYPEGFLEGVRERFAEDWAELLDWVGRHRPGFRLDQG